MNTPSPSPSPALQPVIDWTVTVNSIQSTIARLDPQVANLDAVVATCTALDPQLKAQWEAFSAGYKTFTKDYRDPSFWQQLGSALNFTLFTISDQLNAYATDIQNWNSVIAKSCPGTQPIPASGNGSPDWFERNKGLLIGGLVVVGLLAVVPVVMPIVSEAVATRRAMRPSR